MADLTPGIDFTGKTTASVAQMHQLVDSAYLNNVKNADLVSGVRLINITTPGSPATGDVRIDATGLLEFYFNSTWNAQPARDLKLSMVNNSGVNLFTGDVVVADHTLTNAFTRPSLNPAPDVVGVLAENITAGSTGLILVRGIGNVRVVPPIDSGKGPGLLLGGPDGSLSGITTKVAAILQNGGKATDGRSDVFGITLIATTSGATEYVTCFIWK